MDRRIITANGDYNFACPLGASFVFSASGTFPATITAQYNSGRVALKSRGTLTGTAITDGDEVTIEDDLYTFVTALTDPAVPNEVLWNASESVCLDNLIAAINGASGEGTTYGTGTVAHPYVEAFTGAGDTMIVKARTAGVFANNIDTTATLTTGSWAAATLTGGSDEADRYKPFATTALALTAAGEKSGVNCGAHNEINLNVTGVTASDNVTEVVVIFNVIP